MIVLVIDFGKCIAVSTKVCDIMYLHFSNVFIIMGTMRTDVFLSLVLASVMHALLMYILFG